MVFIHRSVYCFYCKLFLPPDQSIKLSREGYDDWKNIGSHLQQHEKNPKHRECLLTYRQKRKDENNLPELLENELLSEKKYWRDVLKRVVAVITTLAERGLSFRGSNEQFGVPDNGII